MKDSNLNGGVSPSLKDLGNIQHNDTRGYAAAYINMGFGVVPNQAGEKKPAVEGWPDLRIGADEVSGYFKEDQNVGLLLGEPSGWHVDVDLDCPEAVVAADHVLPRTLTGGRSGAPRSHRLFVSEEATSRSYKLPGGGGATLVELRSTGSQTLVEPSVHPTGDRYEWDRGVADEAAEIGAPELELLCNKVATAAAIARRMPDGGRHHLAMALAGFFLRTGRLDAETALEVLVAAWHAAGVDSREALDDVGRAVRDTASKLAAGEDATGGPTVEELMPGLCSLWARWWGWRGGDAAGVDGGLGNDKPTEDELRDRWVDSRPTPTAYGLGEWRRYDGGYWLPVHQEIINREIDGILEEAKPEKIRPTAGMRSSVERMARSEVFVAEEMWDARTDVLVCRNGTLEISSGTLREHRPEDHALGAVPYDFDPDAQAPVFYDFLMSTVPEAAPFLQEFAGYALTTDTSHEIAVWLYGPPGSGKSTFIEAMRAALGHRVGSLGLADIQRSQFALADLPGKTLVVATEQPADFVKTTDVLNAIISGEAIRVEQKYKAAHVVVPRVKVLWAMNDLPRIKDANSGLFRRVKVVPFPRLRGEPDLGLKERIKAEGPGILAWALEGERRRRERGHFEIPESVRAATEDFRKYSDVTRLFVGDVCIVSDTEGHQEQAKNLYEAYKLWCQDNGHRPMSSTAIAKEWTRLGFHKRNLHGRAFYVGIKVDGSWLDSREDHSRNW